MASPTQFLNWNKPLSKLDLNDNLIDKLTALDEKFKTRGQDLGAYLDGLLHSEFLTYWDYIHLDTLLSLQTPKTVYGDENIFIMYHQITELYFKLTLLELQYISSSAKKTKWDDNRTITRLKRINNYFRALVHSFGIMIDGMDKAQFMKFRMALLPASGFQSAQYRKIEIYCTGVENLVHFSKRESVEKTADDSYIKRLYQNIYWKYGANQPDGEKTLTLKMFEEKYDKELLKLMKELRFTNLNHLGAEGYVNINNKEIKNQLRTLDTLVNVDWPLVHFKSAMRYLKQDDLPATGGTNWQSYLPPHFQHRIFFPTLWSEEEKAEWGKNWVEGALRIK